MKKRFIVLPAVFMMLSCNNPKAPAKETSANEKLVETYFKHFNNHEWKKLAQMYTETSQFKDPSLGPGLITQTRQQTINKYSELNKVFPDLHDKIMQVYPSGEKHIIVEFVSSGTAADSSKFELPICAVFTIENGLITKDFSYFDNFEEKQ
ncbi:nuclear transport factor 2 family protein [Chryseobacterium sp. Leaf201]|uniref:nuclear transport factor 2 family protein n=1 Tax=Chryseobacterium sp. Leaf201 TaxID=1735672 RepID=UPI0006F20F79|nr:nuclear transport factor 2 family protein [Chryseobacterium sp. Leaf201]KQM21749.1 hypothetical protein ASE55_18200 [Chryseobacterium sp. Leaf201]